MTFYFKTLKFGWLVELLRAQPESCRRQFQRALRMERRAFFVLGFMTGMLGAALLIGFLSTVWQ
jgi:hypothetical protein